MSDENKKLSKEISLLKNEIKKLKKENDHLKFDSSNFQKFLARSYITPKFLAPFSEDEKQAFAFMDQIGIYLRTLASKNKYKPLVSIIMPTYNRRDVIKPAIDSILNQTYPHFELLIIDDGSEDNTIEFLNSIKDDRIKIIINDGNKGCSFSRNQGLKESNGEIIMYLDSDNMWDLKYIETMVGAFIELPEADALYSGQFLFKNFDSKHPYAMRFCSFNKLLLHNHNFIDINCFCHKAHVLDKIKGFDESIWRLIDWDFILRVSNSFEMYSVPVLLSKYYENNLENRITNTPFKYYDACEILLGKNKIPPKEYLPLTKKVTIIIPSQDSIKEIEKCINSILSCDLKNDIDIVIVEHDSNPKVLEYLFNLESNGIIKLVLNDINQGFEYGIKKAIDRSDKDSDLLFLKSDTLITTGAIEHMQHYAYSLPNCGLIVPHEMTTKESNITQSHVPYAHPNFECDTLPSITYHNIINLPTFHNGKILELNYVPFFCTYLKRDVYNKILGMNFNFTNNFIEDHVFTDFIQYVLKLKIYQAPDAFVYNNHIFKPNNIIESEDKFSKIIKKNQIQTDTYQNLNNEKALWDF